MYLKKVLNQPNLVGTMMIALLFGAGLVYAFASDGFNVETVTGGEVEAWLAAAGGGSYDDDDNDDVVCPCLYLPGQESDRECGECKSAYECNKPVDECDSNCIKKIDEKRKGECGCDSGEKCKGSLCEGKSCLVSE